MGIHWYVGGVSNHSSAQHFHMTKQLLFLLLVHFKDSAPQTNHKSLSPSKHMAAAEHSRQKKSSLGSLWRNSEQFVIRIQCSDNSSITLIHHIKETCQNVLSNACSRLGIVNTELFRLATYKNNEYRLHLGNKCLHTLFPKYVVVTGESLSGSDSSLNVSDTMIKTCKMYLRVVHYVTDFSILNSATLYHYFYQVRWDALKIQNLLCLEGYEDTHLKLGFLSILATSDDQTVLDSKKALGDYFPQTIIRSYSYDELVQMLVEYSLDYPEITKLSAYINFIDSAMKLPAICSYLHRVDVLQRHYKHMKCNCIASISPSSLRIFSNENDKWEQVIKWDVQETVVITQSKDIVTVQCFDSEKEATQLHLRSTANARYFLRVSKEIQHIEQFSVDCNSSVFCQKIEKVSRKNASSSDEALSFLSQSKLSQNGDRKHSNSKSCQGKNQKNK